jgi:ubiquinone/menaquinone biosynthesis C-methylase UbiE
MVRRIWRAFLRFAFHHFYTTFAFTYDFVSAVVSRGRWRAWTRAAIPFIVGTRVLEIPCGTGNLLLDLRAAGLVATGVDLSASMLNITRGKLQRAKIDAPILRARAQTLPFATGAFDSITMTFPPGFVYDPNVFIELRRVLRDDGRLIWVDAARLLPRGLWSRFLDTALEAVNSNVTPFEHLVGAALNHAGLKYQIKTVADEFSQVLVVIAEKDQSL